MTVQSKFEGVDSVRGPDRLAALSADDVKKIIVPSITGNCVRKIVQAFLCSIQMARFGDDHLKSPPKADVSYHSRLGVAQT